MMNKGAVKFQKTTLNEIEKLRNDYLDSIYEEQELFIELQIQLGEPYLIYENEQLIGYFIKNESIILEYYLKMDFLTKVNLVFGVLIDKFKIKEAYCKSFDSAFLKACITLHKSLQIIGVLYRDFSLVEIGNPGKINAIELAKMSDLNVVSKYKDEIFENDEEIISTIQNKGLWLFKNNTDLIGYGLCQSAFKGRNSYDIGMSVLPEYRKKGYGAFILNYLKEYCLNKGWQPTCGCDINNVASQKTIEKIGFVSKHNMLRFCFE